NVIEQSAGTGLDLTGAEKLSVNGNFLDDNGKGLNGGPAIEITNVTTASICNNHMTGNGEYSSPYPAQVHFGGTNDGIVVCGNAYGTENQTGDATLKPSYAYDADTGTVLTNSHLYETPPPQVLGVYSPNAQAILPQLQVPQVVPQQITGFTLANSGSTAVAVAAGVAADSSNSVLIPNSGMCTVDLAAANGAGGLDTGSAHQNTTYFYFAIAQASGAIPAGVQSCIASASQTPTFRNTALGQYEITTTMSASSGDNYIYDVGSVAGIRINDELRANAYIPSAVSKRG
ncbi:MAG TPA: hypothetical protein VHX61_14750, partial [Rhizomicrobium sp.]|nr:hypothetical protein [Rhizomicrobium sp.]